MSRRWLGPALTIACAALAAMAWSWTPMLLAGTALADLGLLLGFGAVLAGLKLADIVASGLVRRLGDGL